MLTRDLLRAEMAKSEQQEEQVYEALTGELYRGLEGALKDLYDRMFTATARLTSITPDLLRAQPGIIKLLRYCVVPAISQMRLGQIIGLRSTDVFERDPSPKTPTREQAERLAGWFQKYLHHERFPWVKDQDALTETESRIAEHYAKLCTVAMVSNQNTDTAYRNQRKQRQEESIAATLSGIGLQLQKALGPPPVTGPPTGGKRGKAPPRQAAGGIVALGDVQPGHYVLEKKIMAGRGRKQKADLTARPPGHLLYCIEAKAVGIRLDASKRLKELNDKRNAWAACGLPITTVGVCAGFFHEEELIATIRDQEIPLFFEHDLKRLATFLQTRVYYDSPWDPSALFPEVSREKTRRALVSLQKAGAAGESEEGASSEES